MATKKDDDQDTSALWGGIASGIGALFGGAAGAIGQGVTSQNQYWAAKDTNAANLLISKDQLAAKQYELLQAQKNQAFIQKTLLIGGGLVVFITLIVAAVYIKKGKMTTT